MDLKIFFQENPVVAIAFSGGVDSSYLLYEATRYAEKVGAYFIASEFVPAFELEDARRMAMELDVPLTVLRCSLLSRQEIMENTQQRCYYCKRFLFSSILRQARQDGFPLLLDGNNADDDTKDRPGMIASQRLGVRSPLRECGLDKNTVRLRSKEAGLFTYDKPAYACLATRIPTGTPIRSKELSRIERAENALFSLGFTDFRIRWFHGSARIQTTQSQWGRLLEKADQVQKALSPFFSEIFLDIIERR